MFLPQGFAGLYDGAIFGSMPEWVDREKRPGHTSQQAGLGKTAGDVATLRYFIFSPNLVWCAIAIALHAIVPYDIEAAKTGWSASWVVRRLGLNATVATAYYGFFFLSIYRFGKASRKFSPESFPTYGNMLHNVYYWFLGVLQWTFWECVMCRLWATGVVGYKTDQEIFRDPYLLALNGLWVLLIPLWRDVHFYIAHRFIHIRAIYKYVHSLHHRNTDPEPFSGMTMHPVEHLYYFSNAFVPCLYSASLSPLIFLWCFVHLTLAPGASHSGFEDHFQADQYHFLHHAKFECNYGSSSTGFVDTFFGTFRDKLGSSKTYKGEWTKKTKKDDAADNKTKRKRKVWSAHSYLGLPASATQAAYNLFSVFAAGLCVWGAIWNKKRGGERIVTHVAGSIPIDAAIALVVSVAPIFVALLLCILSGDRMSWRWPFHKERVFGGFGLFVLLGFFACVMPMYHATKWAC